MGTMQRRKGKAGELELARLLRKLLGANVARNLEQTRQGLSLIHISEPTRPY